MKTFRDLFVWQQAHQLVLETYKTTQLFPALERYGLIQQMRRAAISVAANIAGGHRRRSKPEFLRFLDIAHGSLDELEYYFLLVGDLGYSKGSTTRRGLTLSEQIGKMLSGLKTHVREEVRHA